MNRRMPFGLRRNLRGPSRVASAFEPAQLPGMIAWYRGDQTVDTDGAVATWTDLSGHDRHLTQGTATARPTPVTRAGQRALSFDGTDFLQVAFGAELSQPTTIYAVWEVTNVVGNRVIFDGDDTTNRQFLYCSTTPLIRMGSTTEISGGTPSAGQIYASACVFNSPTSAIYAKSNFISADGTGVSGNAKLDGLTVGAAFNGTLTFIGYVWEVIVCTGAHDAAVRKLVGDYFSSRYDGLTVTT